MESNENFIWMFPMIFQIFPKRPSIFYFHPALNWMWEQSFLFFMTWRSKYALGNSGSTDRHVIQSQQLFLSRAAMFVFFNLIYSPVKWKGLTSLSSWSRGWKFVFIYHFICYPTNRFYVKPVFMLKFRFYVKIQLCTCICFGIKNIYNLNNY